MTNHAGRWRVRLEGVERRFRRKVSGGRSCTCSGDRTLLSLTWE
jgi:hypothetical protein